MRRDYFCELSDPGTLSSPAALGVSFTKPATLNMVQPRAYRLPRTPVNLPTPSEDRALEDLEANLWDPELPLDSEDSEVMESEGSRSRSR